MYTCWTFTKHFKIKLITVVRAHYSRLANRNMTTSLKEKIHKPFSLTLFHLFRRP